MATLERYPAGASPFGVKGGLYLGTRAFFETQVEGGVDALYRLIDDPTLLAFIQQTFLAASYYDILPVAPLIQLEARAARMALSQYLRKRAEFQAARDLAGVYKVLLKLASPEMVALRFPKLAVQMLNFGKLAVEMVDGSTMRATLEGSPVILETWWGGAISVYLETLLLRAGAATSSARTFPITDAVIERGVVTGTLRFEVTWS